MYFYCCSPIDEDLDLLPVAPLTDDHCCCRCVGDGCVQKSLRKCLKIASKVHSIGWEGDFLTKPRLLALPNPDHCAIDFGFIWKQRNNGSVFIASPRELPWLGSYDAKVDLTHFE